jgi:hypothetical protein
MDDGALHKGKEKKKRTETGLMASRVRVALNLLCLLIAIKRRDRENTELWSQRDLCSKFLIQGRRSLSSLSYQIRNPLMY